MRRILLTCGLVSAALFLAGMSASACGDKLLALGRGVRFQTDTPPASILLYMHAGSPGSAMLSDLKFQSSLRDAGHKLHAVGNREELEEALKTGRYDIVLTDLADATALEQPAQSAPSKPVLLPVIYNGTKAQAAAAERHYGCLLKAPGRTGHYLAAVDKAMELKSKRNSSKLVASR